MSLTIPDNAIELLEEAISQTENQRTNNETEKTKLQKGHCQSTDYDLDFNATCPDCLKTYRLTKIDRTPLFFKVSVFVSNIIQKYQFGEHIYTNALPRPV